MTNFNTFKNKNIIVLIHDNSVVGVHLSCSLMFIIKYLKKANQS